jgi:MFS transporter, putative metabolite:H+ symporter
VSAPPVAGAPEEAAPPANPAVPIARLYVFALLGWAFDFYDLVLLGFIKDPVARDLHLNSSQEAWLLGVALGASGIGGIVGGALSDRVGKRTMLAWTVLIYSLGSLVCGLAPSAWVFVAGRAIVGLGVGGEWAIGHGMLAEAADPKHRGRWSAALQSGEPLGVAMAAVVGYLVLPHVGWRRVLIGSSATALVALFARRSAHLPNTPSAHGGSLGLLVRAGYGKRLVVAWILGVFKLGTYWTCYTWLPGFLRQMHQEKSALAWMLTAQLGQLFGMLTFGVVSDRLGRRSAFAIYSVVTASAIAALAFGWESLSARPPLFWGTMLTLGVGSGCTAGFGALLAELFPTEVRGVAMGTAYNLARGMQLLSPVLVHAAVSRAGLEGGLSVPLVLALATASWVWVLPETRGIPLPSLGNAQRDGATAQPRRRAGEGV